MVTTVTKEGSQTSDPLTSISGMIGWIGDHILIIILFIIAISFAIGLMYLIRSREEERKERDDPVYTSFKNTVQACEAQADTSRIETKWRLINLFWLGIPLKKRELSSRVVDMSGNLMGWYRGHCFTQEDQCYNLLLYKDKSFGFFENLFVLKCPWEANFRVEDPKDSRKTTSKTVKLDKYYEFLPNGNIVIWCKNYQVTAYFRYPVLVSHEGKLIDLSYVMNEKLVDSTHTDLVRRILADGTQMIEKAMQHNPHVKYKQQSAETTEYEESNK